MGSDEKNESVCALGVIYSTEPYSISFYTPLVCIFFEFS